jgi:hypothetical protein
MEFNILDVVQQLVAVMLTALIPYLVVLIRGKFASEKDTQRMQQYDTVAEGILNLIRIQHPDWSIVNDVDRFKDTLVDALLSDARSTNNPAIAERVAASAVVRAGGVVG